MHGESGREREGGREEGREGGRERGTPPTKLFRLGRLFAGASQIGHGSENPGSPNLTSEQHGTPPPTPLSFFFCCEIGSERITAVKKQKKNNNNQKKKLLCHIF